MSRTDPRNHAARGEPRSDEGIAERCPSSATVDESQGEHAEGMGAIYYASQSQYRIGGFGSCSKRLDQVACSQHLDHCPGPTIALLAAKEAGHRVGEQNVCSTEPSASHAQVPGTLL